MLTFDLDYILLYLLVYVIFYKIGEYISKGRSYWQNVVWCILIYVFVSGSRYMRGNDYRRYVHTFLHDDDTGQFCFTFFNRFLRSIGINEYVFLYIYAIIFICAALVFLKQYRKYAVYMFPIFVAAFLVFDEYMIRQALGFSFVFLYLKHLTSFFVLREMRGKISDSANIKAIKEILYCFVFALIAYSIHSANAITIIILTGVFVFIRIPIPWVISIPLYVLSAYVLSTSFNWDVLTGLLSYLGGQDELFAQYSENSDFWFSDMRCAEDWQRNPIIKVVEAMGNGVLFYFGYKLIKQRFMHRQDLIAYYNVFVIGSILRQIFFTNELMRRMSETLNFFWFIPLSLVIYYRKKLGLNAFEQIAYYALSFFVWDVFRYFFFAGNMTKFLWDINCYE